MNVLALMRLFTIRFRMLGAIAVVLLLLGMLGSVGMWGMLRIHDLNQSFVQGPFVQTGQLAGIKDRLHQLRLHEKDLLLRHTQDLPLDQARAAWQASLQALEQQAQDYAQALPVGEQQTVQDLLTSVQAYATAFTAVQQGFHGNQALVQAVDQAVGHLAAAPQQIQALEHLLHTQAAQAQTQGAELNARARWLFIAAVVITVLVVGPLTWLNMLAICRPLGQAQRLAQAIAQGNLTEHIDSTGRDEVADLQRALQEMQRNLNRMVGQVRAASHSIALASQEIASGNADLSARTEQTAGNLQHTVASLETLTATVQQTASASGQAHQLATSASHTAGQGGVVVQEAVSSMQAIAASSRRIGDIIGLIDAIAFQTNILALNAAVEAARAGEQGRGFAVVAGEVRLLAQRSADAASEIKQLIRSSVAAVDGGVRHAEGAGNTMQDIVAGIQRVVGIMGEITSTATEQSSGIAQLNLAVGQIDQMTQQNAALVEESAAAAASLRDQAQRLAAVVDQFKLDEARQPAQRLALARPASA